MSISSSKRLVDKQRGVKNRIRNSCGGSVTSSADSILNDLVVATAVRQRVRPAHLLPTSMTWEYRSSNGPFSWDDEACHEPPTAASGGRSGTVSFIHGTSGTNIISGNNQAAALGLAAKAASKITKRSADIAETAFELRPTAKMIAGRARTLANLAKNLKQGRWKDIEGMIGDVPSSVTKLPPARRLADGWLELQFGWLPLVSTAYTAVDTYRNRIVRGAILKGSSYQGKRPTSSSSASASGEVSFKVLECIDHGGWPGYTYLGVVGDSGAATLNSIGFANPLLVAWNLLPYSFVVDWFLPVSDVLAALTAGVGLTSKTGVLTYQVWNFREVVPRSGSLIPRCGTAVALNSYRSIIANPSLAVLPQWSPRSTSLGLLTTSVALLAQQFGRR